MVLILLALALGCRAMAAAAGVAAAPLRFALTPSTALVLRKGDLTRFTGDAIVNGGCTIFCTGQAKHMVRQRATTPCCRHMRAAA